MSVVIDSIEKLKELAANRPPETRTYRVTSEVAEANYRRMLENAEGSETALQPMTTSEMKELAEYVQVDVADIKMLDPHIDQVCCPGCGRRITFTDLIHEAVSTGRHSRQFMGEVLLGIHGQFITVSGTDDHSHVARCLECGDRSVEFSHDGPCDKNPKNYGTKGSGSYGHCAW